MTQRALTSSSRGFALVEALASLVVVGMIGLMLMAGVTTGRRVWERIDTREASGETLDAAQISLRGRLEQAFPQTLYDEDPPYIEFQGTDRTVTFLANPPESGRPAPLRHYTLSLDTAGELSLASISDPDPPEHAIVTREVLLRGVRQIDLAYFGPAEPDQTRRWRPVWHDNAVLPELIRVRLAFEPGDPQLWPDLIVRPQATIDSACLLNTISHRCKGRQ